jgi:phytoene dehydrogenase-like protein
VIGSGMGGMVTAATLSKLGHKVLVLEQYDKLGGQTHSFSREGFSWDAGLHCLGGFGPDGSAKSILDWLCESPIDGLYLTGQDVLSPGIPGAFWGGFLCAGSIDPKVFMYLNRS